MLTLTSLMRRGRASAETGAPLPLALATTSADAGLDATLRRLDASSDGLTEEEAALRLVRHGVNEVAHEKSPHWLVQLLATFKNPFIVVLAALAAISMIVEPDELKAPLIIGVMIGVSVVLRFWQEFRSARAAEALRAMVRTTATVLRRTGPQDPPERREIPIKELVPGDIVHLGAGDMVPADVRLVSSKDLFVSQAILTGESIPVEKYDVLGEVAQKSATAAGSDAAGALDLATACYMGTNIVSGQGTAVVVATGPSTYFGTLAKSIVGHRPPTAFDRGVNRVSWVLIRFMMAMVPVVLLINGFTKGDWLEALAFALSVAVGLTPEMLPLIVSANLARGAVALSRQKVVVKRLNAIQNFGAMDVLCTDKTGTLTQDKVILERHLDVFGESDEQVLRLAWLNSHHQTGVRNLLDQAVLRFADELARFKGLRLPMLFGKVDEMPFDFVRRRLSVVVTSARGAHLLVCKGAVEEMLSISTSVRQGGAAAVPLDDVRRADIVRRARALNEEGFRVIVVATREFARGETRAAYGVRDEAGLTVQGFLAFLDPPKDSARAALAALREHGVAVKILTGDNPVVTARVGSEVGLEIGEPVLGRTLDGLDDAALRDLVERTTVFAKMSPLHKARVVAVLKANGHTVGFLGDGINDAPALRDADVGISVDSAADIAKESADIILLEKSLMVLEEGVVKGRETFGNIIKYIKMTASSNFGNVFSILVASAFLPFLPMLPLQLLIQNLCYDISQLSIPWDRMDREYLARPRAWEAGDIARFMLFIGPISSIFDVTTYLVMWYALGANDVEHQSLFQSGWFIEGLLSQTLIVHMIRTERIPFLQSTAAPAVLLMTGAIVAIGIAIPFSSLGAAIGLQPLPWSFFPWLVGILLAYCALTQAMKTVYRRRFGMWL
jgi:P-type Mg2+ transporter